MQALEQARESSLSLPAQRHIPAVAGNSTPCFCSVSEALRCLADQEYLALLDNPITGTAVLCWGDAPQHCRELSEIVCTQGHARPALDAGWPLDIDGGALVQIDYEFPVGAAAAASPQPGQARLWPLRTWLQWQDGACTLHAASADELERAAAQLQQTTQLPAIKLTHSLEAAWQEGDYARHIADVHRYIRHGDVYQINLTMPFHATLTQQRQDIPIYLQLRQHSPAPYAAFFRDAGHSIISHSPERFLAAHDGHCASHPIKGTRKRIAGQEAHLRQELFDAEKDRAELAMIVDLVRNDLGRIARSGSVTVDEARLLMDLPYVHHAAAHISCALKEGCSHADLLAACFPAGSITGAPKIRAMEIISELESQPRAAYCGCFGWLGADYRCELAVAIRCMQLQDTTLRIDAGGGIVIDSSAEQEWQELCDKASAMQQSLRQC